MVAINPASAGGRRNPPPVTALRLLIRLIVFFLWLALFYAGILKRRSNLLVTQNDDVGDATTNYSASKEAASTANVSPSKDWSHCLEAQPNLGKSDVAGPSDKVKNPLWLPAYPTSLPEGYPSFLAELTGLSSASKSYYRSSKTLKRCHNLNLKSGFDGVTCESVHPIVPCQRPNPSAQAANFGNVVLVALRNPLTAFPSYHQEKAEKYHNAKGQVTKEEWASFRDQYVGNSTHSPLFQEWKDFILEWRNMEPYHVAMYLPHEEWVDEAKGVDLVTALAQVLREEGFPVQYHDDDLACLWHKNILQPALITKKKHEEEGRYTPEYTAEQKTFLAAEMRKFANELDNTNTRPGDEQLKDTLTRYSEELL